MHVAFFHYVQDTYSYLEVNNEPNPTFQLRGFVDFLCDSKWILSEWHQKVGL